MADRVRKHTEDGGCVDWPEQGPQGLRCYVCHEGIDERDLR